MLAFYFLHGRSIFGFFEIQGFPWGSLSVRAYYGVPPGVSSGSRGVPDQRRPLLPLNRDNDHSIIFCSIQHFMPQRISPLVKVMRL